MADQIIKHIEQAAGQLVESYTNQRMFALCMDGKIPTRAALKSIIADMRALFFPGLFSDADISSTSLEDLARLQMGTIYRKLREQIYVALAYNKGCHAKPIGLDEKADELALAFIDRIPDIQALLLKDVQAGLDGDPAAGSVEEIIFSYPSINAIFIYRVAHVLYEMNIPYIPRMMTEYAHSKTGIDINPGARIGEYFFIDHGTGVVIGETTDIGDHVKIYQGVTLGALSTKNVEQLRGTKRHPTIEDNVVIYANATILGGNTVIGANSTVAGNTFITNSVAPNTTVSASYSEIRKSGIDEVNKVWSWEI